MALVEFILLLLLFFILARGGEMGGALWPKRAYGRSASVGFRASNAPAAISPTCRSVTDIVRGQREPAARAEGSRRTVRSGASPRRWARPGRRIGMSSIDDGSSAQAFWVYVVGPEPAGVKQNSRTASAAGCGRPNFGRPIQGLGGGTPRCAMLA